ncbi:MAG: helix-turn-helix domain-containing protein [Hyphomicrobiales bacterium]
MAISNNEIPIQKKLEIINLSERGDTVSEISNKFNVSRPTVYKILSRYNDGGQKNLKSRSSRPLTKKLPSRDTSKLIGKAWFEKPNLSSRKLGEYIAFKYKIWIPKSTIIFHLKRLNLSTKVQRQEALEKIGKEFGIEHNKEVQGNVNEQNPCVLDKELIEASSSCILHVGHFSIKTQSDLTLFAHLSINARTGLAFLLVDDEMVYQRPFTLVVKQSLEFVAQQNIVIIIPNKTELESVTAGLKHIVEPFEIIYSSSSPTIESGMFNRFVDYFKKRFVELISLQQSESNDCNSTAGHIHEITEEWNNSGLSGFPLFGKSPNEISGLEPEQVNLNCNNYRLDS